MCINIYIRDIVLKPGEEHRQILKQRPHIFVLANGCFLGRSVGTKGLPTTTRHTWDGGNFIELWMVTTVMFQIFSLKTTDAFFVPINS